MDVLEDRGRVKGQTNVWKGEETPSAICWHDCVCVCDILIRFNRTRMLQMFFDKVWVMEKKPQCEEKISYPITRLIVRIIDRILDY